MATRPPYRPKGFSNFNGAREGLKQKMDYWAGKDFNYEFGVSLGAARGNLWNALKREPTQEETFKEFQTMLKMKNDKKFRDEFQIYWDTRGNLNAREIEKAEKALDEAGGGMADFGEGNEEPKSIQPDLL